MDNIEQKLGFDRIRQMVVEQCTNALATRMAEEMRFITDYEPLCHELKLVEEMRQIVLMESEFPQQDFIDLTPILTHLRVGNTVIPLESLFDLKLSLRTIRECYYFLTAEEHMQYEALRNVAIEVELGYGGKSSQCSCASVPLSSIDPNAFGVGYAAAQALDKLMEKPARQQKWTQRLVAPWLVPREKAGLQRGPR